MKVVKVEKSGTFLSVKQYQGRDELFSPFPHSYES